MSHMLQAKRATFWGGSYEISANGRRLTTWDRSFWMTGGKFTLDVYHYQVHANLLGTKYSMNSEAGSPVASASRVGRKRWTVQAESQTYQFERPSIWRREERLTVDGRPVGSVKRTSPWRNDTVADLPGVPLPVQVFILAVVLTTWDNTDAGAAAVS